VNSSQFAANSVIGLAKCEVQFGDRNQSRAEFVQADCFQFGRQFVAKNSALSGSYLVRRFTY
jgi:hypothetical protein